MHGLIMSPSPPPPPPPPSAAIYLDNQSTTPLDPLVLEAMLPHFVQTYGNPHSNEHVFGWQAFSALENARFEVADLICAEKSNIIFTSGATESVSLAILGLAGLSKDRCRDKIITVATEHACVLENCKQMERLGYKVVILPVANDGIVDLDLLKKQLDDKTLLVSIMLANNEIGVLQPVAEVAKMCREFGCFSHTDATQAFGKIPIDVDALDVDMLSASAHKLYGPKGIGLLFLREGMEKRLSPLTYGGGQEKGLRPSTVAVPLAVGFGEAAKLAGENMADENKRITTLRNLLLEQLRESVSGLTVLGSMEHRLSGNLSLIFPNISGNSLVEALGDRLAVSTGSSCSSVSSEPSHVIRALGVGDDAAAAALRISIGRFNTEEEIRQAAVLLVSITNKR